MAALSLSLRLASIGLLFPILYWLNTTWGPNQYVFDPVKLQAISKNAIAMHANSDNTTALMRQITSDLVAEYGGAITTPNWTDNDWVFNNAGGAMGNMLILHASITEYLIFFGTALQTEGHSGIHLADDYFTILVGEQRAAFAHELEPRIYHPGDQNHLKRGTVIQYSMPSKCFALELAQGWIPTMMPFGLGDTLSSTFDLPVLWKTVRITLSSMAKQALRGKF